MHEGCAHAAVAPQARLSPSERSDSPFRITSRGVATTFVELKERTDAGEMGGCRVSKRVRKFNHRYPDTTSTSWLLMPVLRECVRVGANKVLAGASTRWTVHVLGLSA